MKTYQFLFGLLFLSILVVSCSKDDDVLEFPDNIEGVWSVVEKSGGFAGVNCGYEKGWVTFDFSKKKVEIGITEFVTTGLCEIGIQEGTFDYRFKEKNGDHFLLIDGVEWGLIEEADGLITVDGNIKTSGNGADFFVYTLQQ